MKSTKGRNIVPFIVLVSGLLTTILCIYTKKTLLQTLIIVLVILLISWFLSVILRDVYVKYDNEVEEKARILEQERREAEIKRIEQENEEAIEQEKGNID